MATDQKTTQPGFLRRLLGGPVAPPVLGKPTTGQPRPALPPKTAPATPPRPEAPQANRPTPGDVFDRMEEQLQRMFGPGGKNPNPDIFDRWEERIRRFRDRLAGRTNA